MTESLYSAPPEPVMDERSILELLSTFAAEVVGARRDADKQKLWGADRQELWLERFERGVQQFQRFLESLSPPSPQLCNGIIDELGRLRRWFISDHDDYVSYAGHELIECRLADAVSQLRILMTGVRKPQQTEQRWSDDMDLSRLPSFLERPDLWVTVTVAARTDGVTTESLRTLRSKAKNAGRVYSTAGGEVRVDTSGRISLRMSEKKWMYLEASLRKKQKQKGQVP